MTRLRNSAANSSSRVRAVRTLEKVPTDLASTKPPTPQNAAMRSPRKLPVSGAGGAAFSTSRASITRPTLLFHRRYSVALEALARVATASMVSRS